MWFKNLQIYRVPAPWDITKEKLETFLTPQIFTSAGSLDMLSMGWVAPLEHGDLVHAVNGQFLLNLCIEKKLMPAAVIAEATKLRAAEIEEQQGFAPGRKHLREIKETVADELLPRAFSVKSFTHVWIDPIHGWLGIDSSSSARADDVIKLLLTTIETCPVTSVRTKESPTYAMTNWLSLDSAPTEFTIDQGAQLSAAEGKATVRYVHHTLEAAEVGRHIASGKQCTRLAMTWADRISFMLTDSLTIKRISPLDIAAEMAVAMENEHERFDADFILMTGYFNELLQAVMEALGGEADEQEDLVQRAATGGKKTVEATVSNGNEVAPAHVGDGPDPLYDQAVAVVMSNRRASISLVQRMLRIGYNRAARLLDNMETAGIIGAMQANGSREILNAQ